MCSSASEAYFIQVIKTPKAPRSNGDISICSENMIPPLSVEIEENQTVNWYNTETGGNILSEGSSSFIADHEGTFYAEAVMKAGDCVSSSRTAVSLEINESPIVEDEELQLCQEGKLELDAGLINMKYQWSTGEISQQITISNPGNFSVEITSAESCSAIKYFDVSAVDLAMIDDIISNENEVTIVPLYEGDFEFSLDGRNYQNSNVFNSVRAGIYTAYIRDLQGCNTASSEFPHIVAPKFVTPNNDGYNDNFVLNGLEYYDYSKVRIFDRYGNLLNRELGKILAGMALLMESLCPHRIIGMK